jgi:hypothetical protein
MMKFRFQANIKSNLACRTRLICGLIGVLIYINVSLLQGQIFQDSITINNIREGIGNIYNLKFEEANSKYISISQSYPGHPVLDLYNGMMIYWKNFPLIPASPPASSFESEMIKCIELSEKNNCPSPKYEEEYLLANLCARGFLLLFKSDNDISGEVIPLARSTYRPLMRSFKYTASCSDFFYFTGVYNYYREAYPMVYPVYKALAFLFPSGNMELGIKQLEACAENSMALMAESSFILSWIRMNFENNYEASLPYSEHLIDQYPSNSLYRICYIKNLLLLKRYNDAERFIGKPSGADNNSFYQAVIFIFNGLIQEKKYHNNTLARELYNKGIKKISVFGAYGNEYAAYGYFGLSRLGEGEEDNHERRMNHRKAMDLADFKKITFDE